MHYGFYIIFWLSVLNKLIFHPKSAGKFYKTVRSTAFVKIFPKIHISRAVLIFFFFHDQRFEGLFDLFDEIYINYVYRRVRDCSHTPVSGQFSTTIQIRDRTTDDHWWTLKYVRRRFIKS